MAWKKPKSKKPTANRCFECGTCLREFPAGWKSRNQHCEQVGHQSPEWECDRCHLYFGSETGKVHHMQAVNHFAHACQLCDVTLPTEARLTEHELKAHYHKCGFCDEQFHRDNGAELQKHELERHFYCCECDRMFQDSREVKVVCALTAANPLIPYLYLSPDKRSSTFDLASTSKRAAPVPTATKSS